MLNESQAQFATELLLALQRGASLFGNSHGDRVVARALMNPKARTASPMQVMDAVEASCSSPGQLWTLFKQSGGVSKADGAVDESEQLEALRTTWASLTANPQLPLAGRLAR